MGKWNRWGRTLAAVVLTAVIVCGCGVKETLLSGRKSEREYGKAESMVIVTTERFRYEELYTDKIWDVAVDESGTTFEETLVNQIHDFLKELKTMSRMADEENVTLSGKERELVKQAAAQYMENLKNAGDSFEITQDVAESLYEDYWKAEKLVETLTENVNLEVSDSEAKVITVCGPGIFCKIYRRIKGILRECDGTSGASCISGIEKTWCFINVQTG